MSLGTKERSVALAVGALSFALGCSRSTTDDLPRGDGGMSATGGADGDIQGGDSSNEGGARAAAAGAPNQGDADAEELCGIEADGRMTCHGDYDGYDSRADYLAGCLAERSRSLCGLHDQESLKAITACSASCDSSGGCETDVYFAIEEAHPARVEALGACSALVDECIAETELEPRDEAKQDCLSYLFVNDAGAERLDACVAGGCADLSGCLDAALDCE